MARRRIGAQDQTVLYLLIGVGAVAVIYFMSRPKPLATPTGIYLPSAGGGYYAAPQSSTTAQDIAAGGAAASSILAQLGNQGVFG